MKLEDDCFLADESSDKPRQCVKKQKHHFADKGLYSQSYGLSSEYSGLISFYFDWFISFYFDSQKSSPIPQFKSTSSSVLSLLYDPTLTSIHDYWENHSFDYTNLCQQSDVYAFLI